MSTSQPTESGRVAVVEIAATESSPAVVMVEVVLDGETLTISDDSHTITERIRQLASELINEVRNEHGKRT